MGSDRQVWVPEVPDDSALLRSPSTEPEQRSVVGPRIVLTLVASFLTGMALILVVRIWRDVGILGRGVLLIGAATGICAIWAFHRHEWRRVAHHDPVTARAAAGRAEHYLALIGCVVGVVGVVVLFWAALGPSLGVRIGVTSVGLSVLLVVACTLLGTDLPGPSERVVPRQKVVAWLAAGAGMLLFAGLAVAVWLAPHASTGARVGLSVAAVLSIPLFSNMVSESLYGRIGSRREADRLGIRVRREWPERGLITQLVVWTLALGAIALISAWVVVAWQQESVGLGILCTIMGVVVSFIALAIAWFVINPKEFFSGTSSRDSTF